MSDSNALMRPTQNPATRFGVGDVPFAGPRMPASAIQVPPPSQPPPAPAAPAAVQPAAGPIAPGVQEALPADRISARVPVPVSDFHPDEHADLHKAMGETFEQPGASAVVRQAYDAVRSQHPHIAPRAALLSARDAFHAVQHGFIGDHATARQAMLDHPAVLAHPEARRK
jgi:hypothetical protein